MVQPPKWGWSSTLVANATTFHIWWHYMLHMFESIWPQRWMGFRNLPTYVPSTMLDHPNAHETSMSTCKEPFHQHLYQLFNLAAYMPKNWECNPINTPTHLEMWGLDRPSNWRIRSAELVWISANVTQALNTKKLMVVTEHFYPNEDGGRQNFLYQIMWGYLMRIKVNFTLVSIPKEYDRTLMGKRLFILDKMH
jgi:hypothetical protein